MNLSWAYAQESDKQKTNRKARWLKHIQCPNFGGEEEFRTGDSYRKIGGNAPDLNLSLNLMSAKTLSLKKGSHHGLGKKEMSETRRQNLNSEAQLPLSQHKKWTQTTLFWVYCFLSLSGRARC